MALGSTMLQFVVDQQLAQEVTSVAPILAEVFEFLSLGTVTVREIAIEKMGGVAGASSAIPIAESASGFATLRLFCLQGGKDEEVMFLAPSHVASPPFANGLAVILEIRDTGVSSPQANLQVARKLGAHAYFDEA